MTAIMIEQKDVTDLYRFMLELDRDYAKRITQAAADSAQLVQRWAQAEAPVRTGALRRSIRVRKRGQGRAQVIAGDTKKVPYAKVVHFGSPRRHISPNKFMFRAADATLDEAVERFMLAVENLWNETVA